MKESPISPAGVALLRTVCYFSLFRHPLKAGELFRYCQGYAGSKDELERELNRLTDQKILDNIDDFYFLHDEPEVVEKRVKGEQMTPYFLGKARTYSRLIARFPFVRAVFISGSLSKGYMDKNSDIDYFIITEPGRLWLCRSLLVLFKKIFLLNSHKYFCVNYFIDQDNLKIPDENIFTATELIFVRPMYNSQLYRHFLEKNNWTTTFYPNAKEFHTEIPFEPDNHRIKTHLEKVFRGRTGEQLDTWFFKRTLDFWKAKFREFDESAFDMELRSRKNVSKHHPQGFQKKVLTRYEEKLKAVEHQFSLQGYLTEVNPIPSREFA